MIQSLPPFTSPLSSAIDVLLLRVEHLNGRKNRGENLEVIIEAADALIDAIDQTDLAAFKHLGANDDDDKEKKEKTAAISAFSTAVATKLKCVRELIEAGKNVDANKELFNTTYKLSKRWGWSESKSAADSDDALLASVFYHTQTSEKRSIGTALTLLRNSLGKKPNKALFEKRVALLEELQWSNVAEYEKTWNVRRFPAGFALF